MVYVIIDRFYKVTIKGEGFHRENKNSGVFLRHLHTSSLFFFSFEITVATVKIDFEHDCLYLYF